MRNHHRGTYIQFSFVILLFFGKYFSSLPLDQCVLSQDQQKLEQAVCSKVSSIGF